MRTFTDNAGRSWTIAINVNAIKRVRGLLNLDLLGVLDGTLTEKLIRDPVTLCDVIYAVCKPEADGQNVSDEDFGRAMAGDAIERATAALLEDLADFSPSPRDRAIYRAALQRIGTAMDRARDRIETMLRDGAIDRRIAQALEIATDSSGSAPGSSESTPDP